MAPRLPPVRAMQIVPGGQMDPAQVVGRDGVIASWWEALEGGSLRLNEPRRLGKTAALGRMVSNPPPGWLALYQSFQNVHTVEQMVVTALGTIAMHQHVTKRIRDRVVQFLGASATKVSVGFGEVTFSLNPAFGRQPLQALEAALRDVAKTLDGQRLLLAWDEVPDMLGHISQEQGPGAAEQLLEVLRRLRESPDCRAIRWIMTGSVGFHHVLRTLRGGDSLINDLSPAGLPPLDRAWTEWLAASLCRGISYDGISVHVDEVALRQVAEVTGGIPFLVQLMAKRVRDSRLRTIVGCDMKSQFQQLVADADESHQMTHFLTRINSPYDAHAATALWLLDRLAEAPATRNELRKSSVNARYRLPDDDTLQEVLRLLILDHYVVLPATGIPRYEWRYAPLASLWRARRGRH